MICDTVVMKVIDALWTAFGLAMALVFFLALGSGLAFTAVGVWHLASELLS